MSGACGKHFVHCAVSPDLVVLSMGREMRVSQESFGEEETVLAGRWDGSCNDYRVSWETKKL